MDIRGLERIAGTHYGAIHRDETSLSDRAWLRAHDSGLLIALHPNVARLAGTPDHPELRIAAAVLAGGQMALASHRSAARLWGIPRGDDDPVDLILPMRAGTRRLDGVRVHRPRDQLGLRPPMRRSGIACTELMRTLCDLGAVDRFAVRSAVGHVLAARMTTLARLRSAVIDHSEHGRHGVVAFRRAVDEWEIDGRPADSVLEVAMKRLVRRFALPPIEFHPRIEGWEIDFRVAGTRVLLECDGWTSHGLDRNQFERDRRRDAELSAAGWIVLRFTYRAIVSHPAQVAARIRTVLDRWSPAA